MANIITFSSKKVPTGNKLDKITADSTGYYPQILSAFNVSNGAGTFYHLTENVKRIFKSGTVLRRRLDGGYCKSELGHPNIRNLPMDAVIRRIAHIDQKRVCAHIKSVELKKMKDENGKEILVAVGRVKQSGPYADSFKATMENTEENIAFSARFMHKPLTKEGVSGIEVTSIFTWDVVDEPNIGVANRHDTAGLDRITPSIDSIAISEEELNKAIAHHNGHSASLDESDTVLRMIKTELGWTKVEVLNDTSILDWK